MNAKADGEKSCEECGCTNAIEIGDKFLCVDCISNSGSSCGGAACDCQN